MSVTAGMVKELRERTGVGMMECKRALVKSEGDLEKAADLLRKMGAASAQAKAGRIAADGTIIQKISADGTRGVLIEVNCETDFVARDDAFTIFANQIVNYVEKHKPLNVSKLLEGVLEKDEKIQDIQNELIGRIGENVSVRRFEVLEAQEDRISGYSHGRKIGVLVLVKGGTEELGHDLAMHIAASKPSGIDESEISKDTLSREREIYISQAKQSDKPEELIQKIVDGRIKKYLQENTLLGQNFVKDTEITIAELLNRNNAEVKSFIRFELGEGLEKKSDDFISDVLAQAAGT